MGFTYVEVCLFNPADLARAEAIELLVDSGAMFTSILRNILEGLELKPITRRRLRVYGGNVIERDLGGVVVEYKDKRALVPVIFGEPGDTPILGGTALESLGYQLDPATKELKPIDLLMI